MLGSGLWIALLGACAPLPSEVGPSYANGSSSGTGESPTEPHMYGSTGDSGVNDVTGHRDSEDGTTVEGSPHTSSTGGDDSTAGDTTEAASATEGSSGDMPSCADLYGEAEGYVECASLRDECHFASWTSGGTCMQMCASFGGECLGAYDNHHVEGQECTPLDASRCDSQHQTEICVCSR